MKWLKKILGKPTDKASQCPKCGGLIETLPSEFTGETIFYCPKSVRVIPDEELYTVKEASPLIGKSIPTLWRWIKARKILIIRSRRNVYIPKAEVDRLMGKK